MMTTKVKYFTDTEIVIADIDKVYMMIEVHFN